MRLEIVRIAQQTILHGAVGPSQIAGAQKGLRELCISSRACVRIRCNQAPLQILRFGPTGKIRGEMLQRFKSPQIVGVPIQYVPECLTGLLIVSEAAIGLRAAPRCQDGIWIENERCIKRVIGALKIGVGECGASASDGNVGGNRPIFERMKKMIASVSVFQV